MSEFKVRFTKLNENDLDFILNKVYNVKDGKIVTEDGFAYKLWSEKADDFKSFKKYFEDEDTKVELFEEDDKGVYKMKQRGFEVVKEEMLKGNKNAILPIRGDKRSAGYDISIPHKVTIQPHSSELIWTNIKAYMQDDEVLLIHVRSSIGIKKGLILKNVTGVIDSSYFSNPSNDGNIGICLYNNTDNEVTLEEGERVAQGIFQKYLTIDDDRFLNEERTGGIGSTSK